MKTITDLYCKCSHYGQRHYSLGCLDCKDKAERRVITVNGMCWHFEMSNLSYLEWKYEQTVK